MGTKITDLSALAVADAADVVPIVDVSTGETKKITTSVLFERVVADFSTAAITVEGLDGSGPLDVLPLGLSGDTPIVVSPSVNSDPNATGHGVSVAGGTGGANDQDGGTVEIDAGAGNGAGVSGNVKIGRNASTEILIGLEGVGSDITLEGQVTTIGHVPSAAGDVATKGYVDQPAGRTVSGTTDNITAADIGGVVLYSQAGGVEAELPDLSSSLIAGKALILTLQATNAATVITVDPGTSVTIDGSASNFVAPTGKSRISLISLDGLAWYSGTP